MDFTDDDSSLARERRLLRLLREQRDGADEYAMIKSLQSAGALPGGPLTEPLTLFRCHFLLYNALYRLRDRLWRERRGHLDIGPLATRLLPYRPERDRGGLARPDPMRAVYLDLGRARDVSADDVQALLQQFWTRFYAAADKRRALDVLALAEPVDYATIKRRYRRLAMRHHPDRGGDAETLKTLNEAMAVLDDYYRP